MSGKRISRWDDADWTIAFDSSISLATAGEMIGCSSSTVRESTLPYGGRMSAPGSDPLYSRCVKCRKRKPLDDFAVLARRKNGRNPECKACRKEYREANRESIAATARRCSEKDPGRQWRAKYNQRFRAYFPGEEPTPERVTIEQVIEAYGDQCYHCGGPFSEIDHYPTPVRHRGEHALENLRPTCGPCNRRSMKVEDMQLDKQRDVPF